ncbi:nucleotidyltransferase domain-containing protein [Kribbella sp. CA-247076]|uniref:nucleotidyltransferase domain-containing protein n=1 Tax=Kribbella sp. CA-247076 TaxID=3239941 RepID=UPI003D924FBF
MTAERVLVVLELLGELDVWVDGGWGVDALVGRQTRVHGDLDLGVVRGQLGTVIGVLGTAGYVVTDERFADVTVQLTHAVDGQRVDLHPSTSLADGGTEQLDFDGNAYYIPPPSVGLIGGREVRCMPLSTQLRTHQGYALRPQDLHDLDLLHELSDVLRVSVVVPTVGRDLTRILEGLAHQTRAPRFEVIVAVDGSAEPEVGDARLVRLGSRQGVSVARNRAVELAGGELIGFLDDDTVPGPDWVRRLAFDLLGKDAAVAGRVVEEGDGVLNRLRRLAFEHRSRQNGEHVDYVNGGNCGFRAEVFRKLGGFDAAFVKSQDRDLARRAVLAGHTITYDAGLTVTHSGSYTLKGLWIGRFKAGRAAKVMQKLSGDVSVGPRGLRATYGAGLIGLAREHGVRLALAALVSVAAHRAGWIR